MAKWYLNSWKNCEIKHMPSYDNMPLVAYKLRSFAPLVKHEDVVNLSKLLSSVQEDNAFILQIGECAETFVQSRKADIVSRVKFIEEIASILAKSNKTIIKIGRIAGQYAKPRTQLYEDIDGVSYGAYLGDIANGYPLNERVIDATRLLNAYYFSKYTLEVIKEISPSLFTSHEGLILDYEESLTRMVGDQYYNLSAHTIWIGERTRFLNSAHVEFAKGIANPIGIKVSSTTNLPELLDIIKALNPDNIKGKIMLINRLGVGNVNNFLPSLLSMIQENNLNVLMMVDPMHGNTFKSKNDCKTRNFDDIIEETLLFKSILDNYGVYFAGIHIEASYENVSECLSNIENSIIKEENLYDNYLTYCDPRLNEVQTKYLANKLIDLIK
jgi:3-deoxy-7-phosphoheptulonate synthase